VKWPKLDRARIHKQFCKECKELNRLAKETENITDAGLIEKFGANGPLCEYGIDIQDRDRITNKLDVIHLKVHIILILTMASWLTKGIVAVVTLVRR
jgi:hypothetical protein